MKSAHCRRAVATLTQASHWLTRRARGAAQESLLHHWISNRPDRKCISGQWETFRLQTQRGSVKTTKNFRKQDGGIIYCNRGYVIYYWLPPTKGIKLLIVLLCFISNWLDRCRHCCFVVVFLNFGHFFGQLNIIRLRNFLENYLTK